jgi:hypothetical protein
MTSSILWNITPCIPLKVNRRFGGTCLLHLQGRRISKVRNQHDASSKIFDFQRTTRRCIPEGRTFIIMLHHWHKLAFFFQNLDVTAFHPFRPAVGLTQFPIPATSVSRSPQKKQPRCEAVHPRPSSSEYNSKWSKKSTAQYVFMEWCLIKQRSNFTYIIPII